MLLFLLNLLFLQIVESADLYKTFFNATNPKEETCKYILAGFGATWITIIAGVIAYWLVRRRPVPNYTYEMVNEGPVGKGSFLRAADHESLNPVVDSQCRRRQISEVALSLSQR